jgi:hypothetical protein
MARVTARATGEEVEAMKRMAVWMTLAVIASAVAMGVFAPAAAAGQPVKSEFTFSDTGVAEDGCAFPVTVNATGSASETDFFDRDGALTRIHLHAIEQDTYSANGKSLQSASFTYDVTVLFDKSGNVTDALLNGVIAKVPLPDGGLFISAGRVDLAARGFPMFILTPDVGATVNLDRFCAALAP